MKRSTLLAAILVLAVLGLADAWYLAHAALTNTALNCNIEALSKCNTVAQSPYSRLLGVPLGVYGVAFYGAFLVNAIALLFVWRRFLARVLVLVSILGFLASVGFVYIQVALIKAVCVYCLGSFVISTLLFVLSVRLLRKESALDPTVVP